MDYLCIIDMQPRFPASNNPKTIKRVIGLMKQAMKRGDTIVLVKFHNWGPCNEWIQQVFDDYELGIKVTKCDDNGAEDILSKIDIDDIAYSTITLCGVNTGCCVARTARGLRELLPDANIVIKLSACNQPSYMEGVGECNTDNIKLDLKQNYSVICEV